MSPLDRPPLSQEDDPIERAARALAVERRVRRERVERAGLEDCPICGGTSEPVDDPTLACDCEERRARLRARVAKKAHDVRGVRDEDRSDRIAP